MTRLYGEDGRRVSSHYVASMKLVSTVFEIEPEHVSAFRAAVFANANAVERSHCGCLGVAIAEDPEAPGFFLTSALYDDDKAAAQRHASEAHRAFQEAVSGYVKLQRENLFDID